MTRGVASGLTAPAQFALAKHAKDVNLGVSGQPFFIRINDALILKRGRPSKTKKAHPER